MGRFGAEISPIGAALRRDDAVIECRVGAVNWVCCIKRGAAPRRHPPTSLPTRHVQARHPKPCASDGVGLQPFYHRSLPPSLSPSQAKPSQQAARPPSTSSTDSQSINLPPPSPAPGCAVPWARSFRFALRAPCSTAAHAGRSEEHTSELQSPKDLVCRLLLEKKKKH